MFEKEAEEYAEGMTKYYESAHGSIPSQLEKYLRKAVEYGYNKAFVEADKNLKAVVADFNKANEWHYVKDELPKDNEYVLIYTDLNNCYVAKKVENHFMSKGWGFIPMSTVIAWKEIVLPKESE